MKVDAESQSLPSNHPTSFSFFRSFWINGTSYDSRTVSPFYSHLLSVFSSMRPLRYNRAASTLITIFGVITNSAVTIQVLAAWRTLKWEAESEWESSGDKWQLDGLKLIWALLLVYFSSAAFVCTLGLVGILKVRSPSSSISPFSLLTHLQQNKSSYVRFYRDYSIADFSFCTFSLILATYAAFLRPARVGVCEEFSHHPELMRDMLEMGLNLENCERWLERAVFVILGVLFVIMVVRVSLSFPVFFFFIQRY